MDNTRRLLKIREKFCQFLVVLSQRIFLLFFSLTSGGITESSLLVEALAVALQVIISSLSSSAQCLSDNNGIYCYYFSDIKFYFYNFGSIFSSNCLQFKQYLCWQSNRTPYKTLYLRIYLFFKNTIDIIFWNLLSRLEIFL